MFEWEFFAPLVFFPGIWATDEAYYGSCNYYQLLEPGISYPVASPGYQNGLHYTPGIFCKWRAKSDRPIQIACQQLMIPERSGCSLDVLLIQTSPRRTQRYCGDGQLSLVSESNEVLIILQSAKNSPGGKFFCRLQTTPEQTDTCRCGWKNPTRIVGGYETGINEYPMMAGLVDVDERKLYCGATIVNDRQVITAAHCILGAMNTNNVGVIVGEHDFQKADETDATLLLRLSHIVAHPEYNATTGHNDIAILTTKSVIIFSTRVGPACLPFRRQFDSFAGSEVDILGWGTLDLGHGQSDALRKARVEVMDLARCQEIRGTYIQPTGAVIEKQLCTLKEGRDACQHDSGGPVLWNNPSTQRLVLAAIVSYGSACADGLPAVNSRIGAFIDFILSQNTIGFEYCKEE